MSCELGNEAVVLNLQSGTYFGLNATGTRIWSLIQQPVHVSELHAAMLKEYAVDAHQCDADVRSLLEQLFAAGLIKVS